MSPGTGHLFYRVKLCVFILDSALLESIAREGHNWFLIVLGSLMSRKLDFVVLWLWALGQAIFFYRVKLCVFILDTVLLEPVARAGHNWRFIDLFEFNVSSLYLRVFKSNVRAQHNLKRPLDIRFSFSALFLGGYCPSPYFIRKPNSRLACILFEWLVPLPPVSR